MKGIVCNILIDYRDVAIAARTAAAHGVDMSSYLMKGTQTESWTPNEAKVIQTWIGQASTKLSETLYRLV